MVQYCSIKIYHSTVVYPPVSEPLVDDGVIRRWVLRWIAIVAIQLTFDRVHLTHLQPRTIVISSVITTPALHRHPQLFKSQLNNFDRRMSYVRSDAVIITVFPDPFLLLWKLSLQFASRGTGKWMS